MNYNEKLGFFTDLIANPAAIHKLQATQLEILIQEYPYCNLLHALLARAYAEGSTPDFEIKLQIAAAYAPNHEVLYKTVHRPSQLAMPSWNTHIDYTPVAISVDAPQKEEILSEQIAPDSILTDLNDGTAQEEMLESTQDDAGFSLQQPPEQSEENPLAEIDDEVFEEIVGIENIRIEPVIISGQAGVPPEELPSAINPEDETQKLILGNIAANNYFAFSREAGEKMPESSAGEVTAIAEEKSSAVREPEKELQKLLGVEQPDSQQRVSKYHDEKMPYSFMWWLDKTRKEHAETYQPYVNFKLDTTAHIKKNPDAELQHQYIENIFHLNTIEDLEQKNAPQTIEFDMKRKEDRIIERFIQYEPQIKPPSGDKLDTENKAKKSAEDSDELVTETLARVYVDQLLYHKAADTYKKLALKFPEKRRYFASQIEILERKIN